MKGEPVRFKKNAAGPVGDILEAKPVGDQASSRPSEDAQGSGSVTNNCQKNGAWSLELTEEPRPHAERSMCV